MIGRRHRYGGTLGQKQVHLPDVDEVRKYKSVKKAETLICRCQTSDSRTPVSFHACICDPTDRGGQALQLTNLYIVENEWSYVRPTTRDGKKGFWLESPYWEVPNIPNSRLVSRQGHVVERL